MPFKFNQVLLLSLFGLAALLAWQLHQRLYEDRGQLVVAIDNASPDAVVLSWHREIELPMAKLMRDAFAARKADARRFIVDLDSSGGSVDEGEAVIAVIADMKKTHQVDTRVTAGHKCLSMCVPIFLQGQRRMAAASSRWLFHEPRSVDYFSGEDVKTPEFEKKYYSHRYFERYFRHSDINPQWFARHRPEWQGRDVWRTGRQLLDENANVVTELLK